MVAPVPFPLRRLWLLAQGAMVNRDRPALGRIASIDDHDRFIWAMLPHAARSFAASILLLPEGQAKTAAIGYLYARMLDTYEDLSSTPAAARAAIEQFASRLTGDPIGDAPPISAPLVADTRDRAHLLLVERHHLVDTAFASLEGADRDRVVRLVGDMARGMIEFSRIFEEQRGVLTDDHQVLTYCNRVIGLPAVFVMETVLGPVSDDQAFDAMEVSELIQIANITRDVEKDLQRGIAYHPDLGGYVGSSLHDPPLTEIAAVRRELMILARSRAPSFRRLLAKSDLPKLSAARAAAVMMMLHTDRHYSRFAKRSGLTPWSGPRNSLTMTLTALPAIISPGWADRVLMRVERDLLATT